MERDTRPTSDFDTPRTPRHIDTARTNIARQAATRLLSSAIQIPRLRRQNKPASRQTLWIFEFPTAKDSAQA